MKIEYILCCLKVLRHADMRQSYVDKIVLSK